MKSYPFIRWLFFAVWLMLGFFDSVSARAGWQLSWSDEFNGSTINPNNWTYNIGTGPPYPGWGNNELEYYTTRTNNSYVSDGILHIVARQESYNGSSYTSAKLRSAGLFSQTYGRFEFYAKLPIGQGYWPALWMMPLNSTYGGWAASGEIDVMENKGGDPSNILGTIHFGGTYPNNDHSHGPAYQFPSGDSGTNFHLYAVEWTSNSISWFVDDHLFEVQTSWSSSGGAYPAPFDQPFYILMNLAVGGNFGGDPNGTAVFPGELQVDYVRAYTYVSEPLPPPPLRLRVPFDDPRGTTSSPSDTTSNTVNVTLQLLNGSGAATDFHGDTNSGVAAVLTQTRALDFTVNGLNQPGMPGPVAAVTNMNLGFGTVSNFMVSLWFKQNAAMAAAANIGPRVFVLGAATPADSGAANSIGLKFQTANQLYFQFGATTASVTFATNLPVNQWLFFAAVYDGAKIMLYQGTETNAAALVNTTVANGTLNFGTGGALFIGNRQDRQRSFNGWLDDFRFYTGAADAGFVESVRQLAVTPPADSPTSLNFRVNPAGIQLSWRAGILQAATNMFGPWSSLGAVNSPYVVIPDEPQQFFRVKVH